MMHLTAEIEPSDAQGNRSPGENSGLRRIGEEAAQWLDKLENATEGERANFADWLAQSPLHLREFLLMCAINHELEALGKQGAISKVDPRRATADQRVMHVDESYILDECHQGIAGVSAVGSRVFEEAQALGAIGVTAVPSSPQRRSAGRARAETRTRSRQQAELYRYRGPILQVFLHRRIDRYTAEDLLQQTFLMAIKKIRKEGVEDASLGSYLYRTACRLATLYWREELSHRHDTDEKLLSALADLSLSPEQSVHEDLLARRLRELLGRLPVARDREILERYYLQEEPRISIRESLNLTDMEFNQVLWRARQRFGDLLRHDGLATTAARGTEGCTSPAIAQDCSQVEVFISYAHQDREALECLHAQLGVLRQEGGIHAWRDREISTGSVWENEVVSHLDRSKLFVSLVSPEYLNSRYCYDDEMTRAVHRTESGKMMIVPILVTDCDWLSSPLRRFKTLPGDGKPIAAWDNPNDAYREVGTGLRRLLCRMPLMACADWHVAQGSEHRIEVVGMGSRARTARR